MPFLWYNALMVTQPKPGAEKTPLERDYTRSLLERFFTDETPDQAANGGYGDNVVSLAAHKERLNKAPAERSWLKDYAITRYLLNTDTGAELGVHGQKVANENRELAGQAKEVKDTWTDEESLESSLDRVEHRTNAVQTAAEESGTTMTTADAREVVEEEIDRFTTKDSRGHRTMKSKWTVIKDNWEDREKGLAGFFKFFRKSFVDSFFEHGAIAKAVPGLNVLNYARLEKERWEKEHGATVESIQDGAKDVKAGLRDKKNIEKEGSMAVVAVKEGLGKFRSMASLKGKQALLDVAHGKHGKLDPKDYLMNQVDTQDLKALQRKYPHTFASMAEDYGVKARKVRGKAAVFELSTRVFDWYLAPSHRTRDSLWDEVKEVGYNFVPFSTAYDVWQDGASDLNHLPMWAKYSIIVGETGLDVLSVGGYAASIFTGGTAAPLVAGASTVAKGTLRTGVRKLAGAGVEAATIKQGGRSVAGFVGKMSAQSREVLLSTTSAKVLVGAVALSSLSSLADHVLGEALTNYAVDTAEEAVQVVFERDFTPQQRRALRMVGRTAVDEYRENKEARRAAAQAAAAKTNEGPAPLTDGQIADVSERKAA